MKPYLTPAALFFIAILALYHLGGAWFEQDWRVGFLFLLLPVFIGTTWYIAQTYRGVVRAYGIWTQTVFGNQIPSGFGYE
jgi:hypothetical protein